jgi:hypothetical protein
MVKNAPGMAEIRVFGLKSKKKSLKNSLKLLNLFGKIRKVPLPMLCEITGICV